LASFVLKHANFFVKIDVKTRATLQFYSSQMN